MAGHESGIVRRGRRPRRVALAVGLGLVISATASRGQSQWTAVGPEVIRNGQVEGQPAEPTNPVEGGVKIVAPVPGQADQVILGTTNGGIWRTTNFSNASPAWSSVTSNATFPAAGTVTPLSIAAISFTRNDAARAYAGLGLVSSFGHWGTAVGGPPGFGGTTSPIALLRSTNAGASWSPVVFTAGNGLAGVNISGLQSRGSNVVIVIGRQDSLYTGTNLSMQRGLWRSGDANNPTATFTNLATGTGNPAGLPVGDYTDLVNGPGNMSLMYTAVVNTPTAADAGVYRSTDAGQTWTPVLTGNTAPALPASTVNIKLAGRDGLGDPATVYAAVLTGMPMNGFNQAAVSQVVRFADGGFGAPTVNVMTSPSDADGGVNPGNQGILHVSISGDPSDANVVYVAGDRQPGPMMDMTGFNGANSNAAGAMDYSGRLFRGTFTPGPNTTVWTSITNNNTDTGNPQFSQPGSSPHADSRSMTFLSGNLLESDDGGIYGRSLPTNDIGAWTARIGTGLQVTEVYGVAYDRIGKIVMGSAQDTGTFQQHATGSKTYDQVPAAAASQTPAGFLSGDGGSVAVDNLSRKAQNRSVRYGSYPGLSGLQSAIYDVNNNPVGAPTALNLTELNGANNPIGNLAGCELYARTPAPFAVNAVDAAGLRMVTGTGGPRVPPPMGCPAVPANGGAVWESTDGGNNFKQVGALAAGEGVTTIVAGGRQGGADRINVLFAGTTAARVYRRDAGGVFAALTGYAGNTPWDLATDAEDWSHLFVVDVVGKRVWRSLNADAPNAGNVAFANITGNLLVVAGAGFIPMTVEVIEDRVAVGGLGGVYAADASAANPVWSLLSTGLPNAIVMDMTSDPDSATLFAGTLGRGIWSTALLRHFKCYRVKAASKFVPLLNRPVEDQFRLSNVNVKKERTLCLPANKRNEDPNAPNDAHRLEGFQLVPLAGSPKFVKQTNLMVVNQFGTLFVDAIKPDRLLVPAGTSLLVNPAPLPPPPNPDPFQCYRIKVTKGTPKFAPVLGVAVEDQLGTMTVNVKKPIRLCNPVNENGGDPTAPTHPQHLLCYQVTAVAGSPKFASLGTFANSEFGPQTLTVIKPEELCVPSSKTVVTTTTTTTTTITSTTSSTTTTTMSTTSSTTTTVVTTSTTTSSFATSTTSSSVTTSSFATSTTSSSTTTSSLGTATTSSSVTTSSFVTSTTSNSTTTSSLGTATTSSVTTSSVATSTTSNSTTTSSESSSSSSSATSSTSPTSTTATSTSSTTSTT